MLSTLVDDWDLLTGDERKALIAEIFEEITASELGIVGFLPRETWKPYMRSVVPMEAERVPTERKTGLGRASYNCLGGLEMDGSVLRRAA